MMPPSSAVSVQLAVKVLKKYIHHFITDELPKWSSPVWKEISNDPDLGGKWTIHAVRTNVREDRRQILSIAQKECGISIKKKKKTRFKF